MPYLIDITIIICAYLLGSISFAIVAMKVFRLPDPRLVGSGNPGATNMMRQSGRKAGIFTFIGDFMKAVLAVLLAVYFGSSEWIIALAGLAVFLGHLFPVYHRFRGGKGIATLFGCITVWNGSAVLLVFAIWLVLLAVFRYVSVAGILAAVSVPVIIWVLTQSLALLMSAVLMAALAVVRHRDNIQRLLSGQENKIGAL